MSGASWEMGARRTGPGGLDAEESQSSQETTEYWLGAGTQQGEKGT